MSAYRLLQISDSAFPRGAFAHSYGLETYVAEGAIASAGELEEFTASVLRHGVATLDGVYLREAFLAKGEGDLPKVLALDTAYDAARPVKPLRDASRSVGRQFLRTARGFINDPFLDELEDAARSDRTSGHYPITLGCVAESLGLTCEEALESLCYGAVSGLVSAAVRLVPLGQTEGQRIISNLEGAVREAVETATALSLEDAHSWGPGHEIRAMTHRRLHTRLFVS